LVSSPISALLGLDTLRFRSGGWWWVCFFSTDGILGIRLKTKKINEANQQRINENLLRTSIYTCSLCLFFAADVISLL
jgi:hypothetical protein